LLYLCAILLWETCEVDIVVAEEMVPLFFFSEDIKLLEKLFGWLGNKIKRFLLFPTLKWQEQTRALEPGISVLL